LADNLFPADFQIALKGLIAIHHSICAKIPPQGIYFEALVEKAFRETKRPFTTIEVTPRNQPKHDLLVEGLRFKPSLMGHIWEAGAPLVIVGLRTASLYQFQIFRHQRAYAASKLGSNRSVPQYSAFPALTRGLSRPCSKSIVFDPLPMIRSSAINPFARHASYNK
jgi:hypothetical protein